MSDRFPQMYTAEPDATGTAYDEINSLIYLDDVQNAPTAPEGSTLAKMAGFLTSIGEYNPVERMLGKETFMQKMGEVPTLLMGLGLLASPQKAEKTMTLYRGVNKWFPGKMVKKGKFKGKKYERRTGDYPTADLSGSTTDVTYVTPRRGIAEHYAGFTRGIHRSKIGSDAVVLEFEVPLSYLKKHGEVTSKSTKTAYEYRIRGGIPKKFFKKVHKIGE